VTNMNKNKYMDFHFGNWLCVDVTHAQRATKTTAEIDHVCNLRKISEDSQHQETCSLFVLC